VVDLSLEYVLPPSYFLFVDAYALLILVLQDRKDNRPRAPNRGGEEDMFISAEDIQYELLDIFFLVVHEHHPSPDVLMDAFVPLVDKFHISFLVVLQLLQPLHVVVEGTHLFHQNPDMLVPTSPGLGHLLLHFLLGGRVAEGELVCEG
jgi:hypothetical protein